jgi:hypothetical protein
VSGVAPTRGLGGHSREVSGGRGFAVATLPQCVWPDPGPGKGDGTRLSTAGATSSNGWLKMAGHDRMGREDDVGRMDEDTKPSK